MLLQSKQLVGASILSVHTARVVAQVSELIINPHKLMVVGCYCLSPQTKEPLVLLAQDIRQVRSRTLFIDSTDELTEPAELIRHQEVLDIKYQPLGKAVRTAGGKRLGKVEEYVVDTLSWQVQKIYVHQPLIKSFATHNLIIDRTQITEVTDKQITVADAYATRPAVATPPVAT